MKKGKRKELLWFALFVFPALGFVLIATDIPFVMNIYYCFTDWDGISTSINFVGIDNFKKIFTNDITFWKNFKFTLKFTVYFVIFVNIIALALALVLSKERRLSNIGRALYYIPNIISLMALGLIWKFIFGPGFEALYDIFGWEFFNWSWVGTPNLAFYVIVIMSVWSKVGFYMVTYIAGIISIPNELCEAATIDGANQFQLFRKIKLPLLMPSISITLLRSLTFGFFLFDIILAFTKGGPANSTVSVAFNIYKEAFNYQNYGLATAKSVLYVTFILIITAIFMKFTKSKEVEV